MASNMQQMAAAGQMLPQQMRKANYSSALQQYVYTYLVQNTPPTSAMSWQANVTIGTRLGHALNLITNITLAMNGVNQQQAADYGAKFEKDTFIQSPSKETYEQALGAKRLEFFKRRQANEPIIQNNMNANAQAQAQAAHAQAQAMMNMQNQMGRGQGPQPNFQQMQQQMQAAQIPQQQQQQLQQHAQQNAQPQAAGQQMNMNMMGMGMANQAGRGMTPNPQMGMGTQAGQNRQPQPFANDISRLAPSDKGKVVDLANKIMASAPEEQKTELRMQLQQRMPAHQLAEMQASGKDPLIWFYQNQAFQVLKANMTKLGQQQQQQQQLLQGRTPSQNSAQPAMMQPQNSQQSMQQRQNMMNGAQQGQPGNDFTPFANMESIKDQQLNGLMAQQAGQMVVPATTAGNRNPTPQQNMPPNQPGPNQTPRPQQQQVPQQHTPQQPPQQPGMNMQQIKLNQSQAQLQAQAQAHMKQMQGQQPGMGGGMPSQSPAMTNLNTPTPRQPNNMNPMANQGMVQGNVQFGDQRFNQGIQRPNSQAFNAMLSNMSPEQRQTVNGLPPDKLNEVMRRWQTQREQQMAMNANQMNPGQVQNMQQNQFNPMGQNTPGPNPPAVMQQQPGPQGIPGQQPMQTPRGQPPNGTPQTMMMDAMDLPPQVVNQIGRLPPEVKKWKDLKVWLSQTNTNMPPQMRSSLGSLQQRQFQLVMQRRASTMPTQPGQPPAMNAANTATPAGPMANMQPGMQRPMGNFPPQVLQVSPQELMQVRGRGGQFATLPDEQLRAMVIQMKKQTWTNQQMQQLRAQQNQMPQQPGMPNQMPMPQAPMQPKQPPQPNQTPQPQPVAQPQPTGPSMAQPAVMQPGGQRPARTPDQPVRNGRQQPNNRAQVTNPSPAQGPARNLKRPSNDDTAEASTAAKPTGPAQRPVQQQPNQQPQGQMRPLTPQQIASLDPEQRVRYEQMMRTHMAKGGAQPNAPAAQAANQEVLARLKTLGQEEHQQYTQEVAQDVPMSAQEYNEMAPKLRRLVVDVHKIGRGLNKWYTLTRDDARARMFFRIRLRTINQFEDGETGEVMKNPLSVRSTELDHFRAMLESMAKDLAASVFGRTHMKTQGTPATAANQLPNQNMAPQAQAQQSQGQSQPVPLNAANLEKNTQALNKMKKGSGKASQAPAAPTATQPPFSFGGAASPHGNPSYVGQPKDMNLTLPPARKKQKKASEQVGKSGPGATPSPQIGKNASPEMQRAAEPHQGPPAKPVFLCKDAECDKLSVGFPNEKALQRHVEDEHTKPRENPVKFVSEILATTLGLEPDGTPKRDQRPAAQVMSTTNSKQGQTPSNLAGTPKSQDAAMKRSASALGKLADPKKSGVAFQPGPKQVEAADPWANATIDPQSLLRNLGFENGIPGVIADMNAFRSMTPKDTPESSKDGASEPTSDISDGAALDIELKWQSLDSDLLFNLDHASLEGDMPALDAIIDPPSLANRGPGGLSLAEWDEMEVDFSKPFQFDTSLYSMAV